MRRTLAILAAALAMVAALLVIRNLVLRPDPLARLRLVSPAPSGAADLEVRVGSWWFPRGGPYILGFESPGPAELLIDGRKVAAGEGEVKQRIVYEEPGARAVELRAPAGARLLWHPPGRRGALEYVAPSSLAPEPPAQARFGRFAGTSIGDGIIAGAIVIVLLAAGLLCARPRLDRRTLLVVSAVIALALAVRLVALAGAEQTWDEDEYWSSGRNYVVNLLSLDFRPQSWRWNYAHPPVTKYLAGIGALCADGYGAARLAFVLLGAGTCGLVFAVGRRLFGLRAGVLAGVTAALLPRLVAHDVVVGHETPTVFCWTLGVLLALRAYDGSERLLPRRLLWVGVVVGLACAVRFSNAFLGVLAGVVVLLQAPRGRVRRTLGLGLLIGPVAAVATFYLVWPRLWLNPVGHLRFALGLFQAHKPLPEYYLGHLGARAPWHYFPVYLAVTTPLLVLLAALLLGGWRAASRRERAWFIVVAWLVTPFSAALSPLQQDGVRYVLAAFVPLAIAAGAGIDHLASVAKRPAVGALAGGALGVYLAITCARIHPYYLDYYGEHVGGPAVASARRWFEVGGWGEGIGAAVEWVNGHVGPGARVHRVLMPTHVNWFRGDLWRAVAAADADWIVTNEQGLVSQAMSGRQFELPAGFRLVHEVRAQGCALARIYRRDGGE